MKLKTRQIAAKRFFITKKKKILRRKLGQDHFNSRDKGQTTCKKRRDVLVHHTELKNIKRLMPYN